MHALKDRWPLEHSSVLVGRACLGCFCPIRKINPNFIRTIYPKFANQIAAWSADMAFQASPDCPGLPVLHVQQHIFQHAGGWPGLLVKQDG